MQIKYLKLLFIILIFFSCSPMKRFSNESRLQTFIHKSSVFKNHFTGISIYDLEKDKYIVNINTNKNFVPGSITKLLTMYVTLKSLGDSIPGLLVYNDQKQIVVQPIGDPTFLHPDFKEQKTFIFLKENTPFSIYWPETTLPKFGKGWAWDDYSYSFQIQKSWWPIYENSVHITTVDEQINVYPKFFHDFVEVTYKNEKIIKKIDRHPHYNIFQVNSDRNTSIKNTTVPFIYTKKLFEELLKDTLSYNFSFTSTLPTQKADTLFSYPTDSVLIKMIKNSDNFLAEQLLILSAWKNGYDDIPSFINYAKTKWLKKLGNTQWVDGSGLSRYNLTSPKDQVELLRKSYEDFGWEKMTELLAKGGEGTLKNLFVEMNDPYLFAKTGTLRNIYNLSGYIKTRKGKKLIFCFMNNNFINPIENVKNEIEFLIEEIKETY